MFPPDPPHSFAIPPGQVAPEPPKATAKSRRTSFRRWLWRGTPIVVVLLLLLALGTALLWHRIVIVIEPGHSGVLFRLWGGTQLDYVYPEGVHFINPLNTMYVYEVRKQVALHQFDVLTVRGLTLKLSLAIRYQPELQLLGMLHQRIGPDYLQRVVIPQTESVMRKQLGAYTAQDVYTNKEGLMTKAILLALDEIGRNFVQVEDIIIRSIDLPDKIEGAIEDKLIQEQLLDSYAYRIDTAKKEAERLQIQANGIKAYQETLDKSTSEKILRYEGIQATKELAKSNNAKVVVIGSGKDGLPLILNTQ